MVVSDGDSRSSGKQSRTKQNLRVHDRGSRTAAKQYLVRLNPQSRIHADENKVLLIGIQSIKDRAKVANQRGMRRSLGTGGILRHRDSKGPIFDLLCHSSSPTF